MTVPILIIAAGAGVGWIGLSRYRAAAAAAPQGVQTAAQMTGAADGAPHVDYAVSADPGAGPAGGSPKIVADGLGATIDDTKNSGADPSTSPPPGLGGSDPAPLTGDRPMAPRPGGTLNPPNPYDATTHHGPKEMIGAAFGSMRGVTTYQVSRAINSDLGAISGVIW